MVAQYLAMQPILDLCEKSDWKPEVWVSWCWQEQDGLDLEGVKKRAAAESDGEEQQSEKEGVTLQETPGL